jgi:hypothetical protein
VCLKLYLHRFFWFDLTPALLHPPSPKLLRDGEEGGTSDVSGFADELQASSDGRIYKATEFLARLKAVKLHPIQDHAKRAFYIAASQAITTVVGQRSQHI